MIDREKVLKGLEYCTQYGYLCGRDCHGHWGWTDSSHTGMELLDEYRTKCPYGNCETGCVKTLAKDAFALMKAQEPPTSECISSAIECLLHPQDADDSDMAKAIDTAVRAMRLLKAQEPVGPKKANRYIDFDGEGKPFIPETYDCGNCGKELPWKAKYCSECGRAVKAEWTTYNEPLYITIDMPATDDSSRKEK